MTDLDLTILMPCLNEAETLAFCVRQAAAAIAASGISGEVVVADNGSTDGSQEIARSRGRARRRCRHPRLWRGADRGHRSRARKVRDDGRRRRQLPLRASAAFSAAARRGLRPGDGQPLRRLHRARRHAAAAQIPWQPRALHHRARLLSIPVRDFHCGLRAFRRDSISALNLRTTGMEFASEMVVKASLAGLRMTEVPTTLSPDGRSRPPHLRSWRDGWRHLRFLLLYSPRWLFFYPGLAALAVGLVLSAALLPGPLVIGAYTLRRGHADLCAGPGADRRAHHGVRRLGQGLRNAGGLSSRRTRGSSGSSRSSRWRRACSSAACCF